MQSQKTFWILIALVVFCCFLPFITMWLWKVETLASTPGQGGNVTSNASTSSSQSNATPKPAAK
ncbi:MAG TPA: hypothetical protein VN737_10635 [Bryobacteraceae bacterium]|nr:hypothetical protein [Bryobacteraceae bacterium]